MNTKKLLMLLPLLLVLGLAACDNDNSTNAQDMGEEPGAEQASTTFSGKVVPPGNSSCTGGIAGIVTGDGIEAVMAPTTGMAGTATVTVNQGADGMIACTADGSEPENIDTPPVAFIVCKVTSVSSEITGVEAGDVITIDIEFSGQAPEIKEAAIETADGCLLIQLDSLNATS